MTKTSLFALLRDPNLAHELDECLYVIRDDEKVFYVGQSRGGVVSRVMQHCHPGLMSHDLLREFIECAIDDQIDLTVELLSIADCQSLAECLNDLDEAEMALIALYAPVFNIAGNPDPNKKAPQRYKTYWNVINERFKDRAAMIREMPIK